MIPLTLKATNYGPYENLEIDIPARLTAVVGQNLLGEGADSNGAGKTKLLELLPIALFGPSLPWSEYLTVGGDEQTCTVELLFQHGMETYQVRRTFDARGRGKTTLDFERYGEPLKDFLARDDPRSGPPAKWEPLTRSTQADTQALIEKTIGIGEQTFAHSVFAAQGGQHFADPSLPPRERKAILAEALELGRWEQLLKLVKADVAEAQTEVDGLTARMGAFEDDLARREELQAAHSDLVEQAAEAARLLAVTEQAEREAQERYQALKLAAEAHMARDRAYHMAAQAAAQTARLLEAAAEAESALTAIREQITKLRPVADSADALEAEAQKLAVAVTERQHALEQRISLEWRAADAKAQVLKARDEEEPLRSRATSLTAEIGAMRAGALHCSACGQPLAGDALERAVQSHHDAIRELDERAAAAALAARTAEQEAAALMTEANAVIVPELLGDEVLAEKRETLRAARAAVTQIATFSERASSLEQAAALPHMPEFATRMQKEQRTLAEAKAALDAAPWDGDALNAAATVAEEAAGALFIARQRDSESQRAFAASEERLRSLANLAERHAETLAARTGLQGRLEVLTALARSYGRDGIPALILEATAIPQLETEANRILDQLGARMQFELVTQRETKASTIKDTLDVLVHGENGTLRYESYSGGEQTRLAFALRIALARLIAHRRGGAVGVLALDELPFLDQTGIARVCKVLRGLDEFRSVLLVSHDDRFVEGFDNVLTVVRDEQGSRVAVAA